MSIEILKPGLQTTVQDLGRQGWAHYGISPSGAADPYSLRVANAIIGNAPTAACLEITLLGPEIRFEEDVRLSLFGAEIQVEIDGNPVPFGTSFDEPFDVQKGQILRLGSIQNGARTYLAVEGGFQVPLYLGSASTHLISGVGGMQGRALKKGDWLATKEFKTRKNYTIKTLQYNKIIEILNVNNRYNIRITPGLQSDWFPSSTKALLSKTSYTVTPEFSRMGIRLEGAELPSMRGHQIFTEAISNGAIQVPGNGKPILSFVEHQTTGGYPKIANVITADFWKLGQLKAGDEISFEWVTFEQAEEERLELEACFREINGDL